MKSELWHLPNFCDQRTDRFTSVPITDQICTIAEFVDSFTESRDFLFFKAGLNFSLSVNMSPEQQLFKPNPAIKQVCSVERILFFFLMTVHELDVDDPLDPSSTVDWHLVHDPIPADAVTRADIVCLRCSFGLLSRVLAVVFPAAVAHDVIHFSTLPLQGTEESRWIILG